MADKRGRKATSTKQSRKATSAKQSRKATPTKQTRKATPNQQSRTSAPAVKTNLPEPTAGDYAREAISQWAAAARLAVAAVAPGLKDADLPGKAAGPPLKDRLNPTKTQKGGRLGDAADFLLDKTGGKAGKAASRLGLGSRMVDRLLSGDEPESGSSGRSSEDRDGDKEDGSDATKVPIPIQEAIQVAIPIKAAYELATRFDAYPEFVDQVEYVETIDDSTILFEVKVRGTTHDVRVDVVDERPNRRIDWDATEALEHSGVVTFHELAPSLTHIELTVEAEPHGPIQRLARATHITQHRIRADLLRFKAWAELWEAPEVEDEEEEGDAVAEQQAPDEEEHEEQYEDVEDEEEEGEPEAYEEEDEPEAYEEEDDEEEDYEEEDDEEEDEPEGYEEEDYEDDEEEEGEPEGYEEDDYDEDEGELPEDYEDEDYEDEQDGEYESYDDEDEPAPARAG